MPAPGTAQWRPAWPVILQTTLIGVGQGLFLAMAWIGFLGPAPAGFFAAGSALSLALLGAGLVASRFGPGSPGRTSWLSREAVLLPAFTALVAGYGVAHAFGLDRGAALWIGGAGGVLCLALFACTGMAYASLNFALLGAATGFTLAVPLAVLALPRFAGPLALAAFSISGAAWVMRGVSLIRNARRRPERPLRALRWTFLVLLFPVPGWLLGWGGGTLAAYVAAFLLQYAGLLAERRVFFAEARGCAGAR